MWSTLTNLPDLNRMAFFYSITRFLSAESNNGIINPNTSHCIQKGILSMAFFRILFHVMHLYTKCVCTFFPYIRRQFWLGSNTFRGSKEREQFWGRWNCIHFSMYLIDMIYGRFHFDRFCSKNEHARYVQVSDYKSAALMTNVCT